MNFSSELQERRNKKKMTLRDVEAATGLSNTLICYYEKGSRINMRFHHAILLSRLFQWKLSDMAKLLEQQLAEKP